MACNLCGRPTSNRRHCVDCAREQRQEERARLADGGHLEFETTRICSNCGGSGTHEDDGDYLPDRPGVWMCFDWVPRGDWLRRWLQWYYSEIPSSVSSYIVTTASTSSAFEWL